MATFPSTYSLGLELSHQFYEAVYHIVIHQRDVMREALKVIHQKQLYGNVIAQCLHLVR